VKVEVDPEEQMTQGEVSCKDSVRELRSYLEQCWGLDTGSMPVPNAKPLNGFSMYALTSQEHEEETQYHNTLACPMSRVVQVTEAVPGLTDVTREATRMGVEAAQRDGKVAQLSNFHFLRQRAELGGASSFDYHIDKKDKSGGPLLQTVSVKLTEDPPRALGSWMQMRGGEPQPYGKAEGSTMVFASSVEHRSLETSTDMGTVLKVVFFFEEVITLEQ
jgi:hypothetical protein